MATSQQIETIAKRVSPDLMPGDAVSQTNVFLARVMAVGNLEETMTVEEHFGRSAMREVINNPPVGIFDRQSWNYWHLSFKLATPDMPDSFFTVYPWFRNRTLGICEPLTAERLDRLPHDSTAPVRSCDEQ